MHRRHLLAGAVALFGTASRIAGGQAQTWPDRPVTIINPFSPDGFTDGFGRGIADARIGAN